MQDARNNRINPLSDDDVYMREAIKEAKKAMKKNEVPIGCIIVSEGAIVARAYNLR